MKRKVHIQWPDDARERAALVDGDMAAYLAAGGLVEEVPTGLSGQTRSLSRPLTKTMREEFRGRVRKEAG